MKYLGFACTLLLLGVVVSVEAEATEYYVCFNAADCNSGGSSGWTSGSDSNSGTSRAAAWRCPRRMESANLKAGDVVIIGNGTYTHSACGAGNRIWNHNGDNGQPGNYITVKAENRHGAIIDGQDNNPNNDGRDVFGIQTDNCSYIALEDLVITRMRAGIWESGNDLGSTCHHVRIKGNKIYNHGFSGVRTGLSSHHWEFDSNEIYDIRETLSQDRNHQCAHNHSIYLNGHTHTVVNNVMHSSMGGSVLTLGGWCSQTAADPGDFEFGYMVVNNTVDGNGCQTQGTVGYGDKRYNPIDFWNRAFTSGNCPVARNFKDVTIENNLFLNGEPTPSGSQPSQFLTTNLAGTIVSDPKCQHYPWHDRAACENSTNGDAGYLRVNNNVAEIYVQNPTYQAWSDEYNGNCDQCSNIGVANEANNQYTPQANSTALLNKGSKANAPAYDINGNPRQVADGVDIGAYELATVRPNPPSNVAVR